MFVIIAFFLIMFLVSNVYAYKMLNVSDEDFPNNELMMEGIGNSAGIFFVSYMTSNPNIQFQWTISAFLSNNCLSNSFLSL